MTSEMLVDWHACSGTSANALWPIIRGVALLFHVVVFLCVAEVAAGQASDYISIRETQEKLADLGFDPGPADGVMGSRTRSALRSFQVSRGLTVSGALDAPTSRSLGISEITRSFSSPKHVALVIGNASYAERALDNPVNDARLISSRLKDLGFDVEHVEDASRAMMLHAIQRFGDRAEGVDAALFFYAGHAMQLEERNYLIPVDGRATKVADVRANFLDLSDTVLEQLSRSEARVKIVVLDACRNNPFSSWTRSPTRGLARTVASTGTLIAYSTAPGQEASDGSGGPNSIYSAALAHAVMQPDLTVEQVFKRVAANVQKTTESKQVPWYTSSLTSEFSFTKHDLPSEVSPGGLDLGLATNNYSIPKPEETSQKRGLKFWVNLLNSMDRRDKVIFFVYIGMAILISIAVQGFDNDDAPAALVLPLIGWFISLLFIVLSRLIGVFDADVWYVAKLGGLHFAAFVLLYIVLVSFYSSSRSLKLSSVLSSFTPALVFYIFRSYLDS